jgi:HlyD family secretion protein
MKRIIPIIIILAIIGGGYYWYTNQPVAMTQQESTRLVGSGTIEGETIVVTAELGGRIIDIKVDEGEAVAAGQILVELDKAALLAQQAQLDAAVSTAEANLLLASALPRSEDVAAAQAKLVQTQVGQEGAKQVWEQAKLLTNNPHELDAQVNRGHARIAEAESALESAKVNLKRAEVQAEAASRNQSSHMALVQAEAAQKQLESAKVGVQMAETTLEGMQTQVEHLTRLRYMPLTLIVQANSAESVYGQTQAAVLAAQANLAAVKASPAAEDIAIAQAQLNEAKVAQSALAVKISKQTLVAPRAGLVNRRLFEPGELTGPGMTVLELTDIETVDLTVYIPENRIGNVQIGQPAKVQVDAYGTELFEGVVTFIAHEAEFTPRNVQTQEERVNLVFAVQITLDNADHRLKPGMPADAELLTDMPLQAIQKPTPTSLSPAEATIAPAATPTSTPDTMAETSPTATIEPPPSLSAPQQQVEIITWALNVRSEPGIDSPVVASLVQGETASVLNADAKTGWLEIELAHGETGWITGSSTYVILK